LARERSLPPEIKRPPEIDIAVLDGEGAAHALVQAKTFNSYNKSSELRKHVTSKGGLNANLTTPWTSEPQADVFALVLVPDATEPEGPGCPVPGQIKREQERLWRRYWDDEDADWEDMEAIVNGLFPAGVECHCRAFPTATALGSQVTVRVWLWGPIPEGTLATLPKD
jgi:hypothetical protein